MSGSSAAKRHLSIGADRESTIRNAPTVVPSAECDGQPSGSACGYQQVKTQTQSLEIVSTWYLRARPPASWGTLGPINEYASGNQSLIAWGGPKTVSVTVQTP